MERAPQTTSPGITSPPFQVGKATAEDLPDLFRLINHAYEGETWLFPHPRITLSELLREFRDPAKVFLVGKSKGIFLGTVRVDLGPDPEDGAFPIFGLLGVGPGHRGLGVGEALVRAAEDLATASGFPALHLDCIDELGLPAFYARLGYGETGRTFGSLWGSTIPFTLVRMKKELPAPSRTG